MNLSANTIWSFDIGTGSFGVAIRDQNNESSPFLHVASLLVPDGFAATAEARDRRRMYRTRLAHKAREAWLRQAFTDAGLAEAILRGRQLLPEINAPTQKKQWKLITGDYRLEREFPPRLQETTRDGAPNDADGAAVHYCSVGLRILLLQEKQLAPWQIYKALYSAIQKRGYDPSVPWKGKGRGEGGKEDEKEAGDTMQKANRANEEMEMLAQGNVDFHHPCYLEAHEMGLWDPVQPDVVALRQTHHAKPAKGRVYLRSAVENELSALLLAAAKQLPALDGLTDLILYGPAEEAYASYKSSGRKNYLDRTGHELVQGKAHDWQGVLSQKVPTFDNRAVEPCRLIPRFHAAKSAIKVRGNGLLDEDSLLPSEVTFLMKMKNLRFSTGGGTQRAFTAEEIGNVFDDLRQKAVTSQKAEALHLTKTQLAKIVTRFGGASLLANHEVVEGPRVGGRSRFSKPALKLVKELLLSGKPPKEYHTFALGRLNGNTAPLKGLTPADLQFIPKMGESWERVYLPDESLGFLDTSSLDRAAAIRSIIGAQNNPIIRHRLTLFHKLLCDLEADPKNLGKPERVVIEFVREDFMGEKAKKLLSDFQKKRREARAEAAQQMGDNASQKGDVLKYQLWKDQASQCLYCGDNLGQADLASAEIEHIVPRSQGGPGAYYNLAVACRGCNHARTGKGDRTPHQWLSATSRWDAYVERVKSRSFVLRAKKVRLLLEPDAVEQVSRYQTLAETAWIAKLAQTVVCLHFGWKRNFQNEERRVIVLPGGLTANIRRKYKLNSLLGKDIRELEAKFKDKPDAKVEVEIDKKCRADKRHHALDAMVLSFLPQWSADPTKRIWTGLPKWMHREVFEKYLEDVLPELLCFEKPVLEESIYGQRAGLKGGTVAVKRFPLLSLGMKSVGPSKTVFDILYLKKQAQSVFDRPIKKALLEAAEHLESEEEWQKFCVEFRHPSNPADGALVKSVLMVVADDLTEFVNLAKDGTAALRKGKGSHRGQFLYVDAQGRIKVRPVYVFDSVRQVRTDLRSDAKCAEVIGYFQSGCKVQLDRPVDHAQTPLEPGFFKLNTIRLDGFIVITSQKGVLSKPVSAKKLFEAGFHRV